MLCLWRSSRGESAERTAPRWVMRRWSLLVSVHPSASLWWGWRPLGCGCAPSDLRINTDIFRCGVYLYCLNPQTNPSHDVFMPPLPVAVELGIFIFPCTRAAVPMRAVRALSPEETSPRKEFVC